MAQITYKIDTTQQAKMTIENSNCIVFISLDVYRSNKTVKRGKNSANKKEHNSFDTFHQAKMILNLQNILDLDI